MAEAVWKGIDRETFERWAEPRLLDQPPAGNPASEVVQSLGLRCVGWHHWTGDPATSVPLFVCDEWPS